MSAADDCRHWQAEAAKEIGKAIGILQQARPMEDASTAEALLHEAIGELSAAGGSLAAYALARAQLLQERVDAARETKAAKMLEGSR